LVIGVSAQQKAPLKLLHSTPLPELHDGDFDHLTPDVVGNRLFVTAEENSRVLVFDLKTNKLIHTFDDLLDSGSGKVVNGYPAAAMVDGMAYDSHSKRVYFAGTEFLDVFHQSDADHYDRIGHVATSFRAKKGVLVPELNGFYLAVPHHEKQMVELRVSEVLP
jgi:hypothetical protein